MYVNIIRYDGSMWYYGFGCVHCWGILRGFLPVTICLYFNRFRFNKQPMKNETRTNEGDTGSSQVSWTWNDNSKNFFSWLILIWGKFNNTNIFIHAYIIHTKFLAKEKRGNELKEKIEQRKLSVLNRKMSYT